MVICCQNMSRMILLNVLPESVNEYLGVLMTCSKNSFNGLGSLHEAGRHIVLLSLGLILWEGNLKIRFSYSKRER